MKHTPKNCKDKILIDLMGTIIPGVIEWDDKTETAKLLIIGKNPRFGRKMIAVIPKVADLSGCHPIGKFKGIELEVKIPGAKLVSKDYLDRFKNKEQNEN